MLHHRPAYRTTQQYLGLRTVRWYSGAGKQGGGANGGKGSGKPPEGGGGNFFQNFAENFRKTIKGNEVQDSLKGFHEEREKMQQSYVVQQAKLKWNAIIEWSKQATSRSSEEAYEKWSVFKQKFSKASGCNIACKNRASWDVYNRFTKKQLTQS